MDYYSIAFKVSIFQVDAKNVNGKKPICPSTLFLTLETCLSCT